MEKYRKYLFDNFVVDEETKSEAEASETEPAEEAQEDTQPEGDTLVLPVSEEKPVEVQPEPEIEFEPVPPEPEVITFTEDEVNAKVKIAADEAYSKGLETAKTAEGEQNLQLLQNIDAAVNRLLDDSSVLQAGFEQQFRDFAKVLLRRFIPTLSGQHAEELVKSFLEENFKNFSHVAKLSFYFNPAIIAQAQQMISRLAHSNDFEGKITLHKDAALGPADCRVEWDGGGVIRSQEQMQKKAEQLLGIQS